MTEAAVQAKKPKLPDEHGVPDPFPLMHPLLKKNYGKWAYHDRPRPGVLHHVAKSGDEVWTVRAGTQRQMDVYTIRKLCDIGDQQGEGFVRFTTRSNIEYMVSTFDKVPALIKALNEAGFPVGGTGNSVSMISHTQGWLHCDIPGTDASGVVKSLMDMMHKEFVREEMPNRVRITTSCCQINCGGQGDIAINVQYTKPPKINHDLVANVCERPAVVARCPVANLPNNAPRWPEVEEVVRKILYAYKDNAKDWERMGEWIERIGWPRFFDLTGLAFTKHHIDTWTGARHNMNMSAHIHF
jgi:sulfite reductase beta subunit